MSFAGQLRHEMVTGLVALIAALVFHGAAAAALPGVPDAVGKTVAHARLAGEGSFRWFGLKVYDAQLWVGAQGYRADAPHAAPFALQLRYARTLYGARIAQSSIDEMKKLGAGSAAQHEKWLGRMSALFPDVQEGSRITGVYRPEGGAEFYLDDQPLGVIRDAEFARAFFSIWLDPRTSAPALRDDLLRAATLRPSSP